MNAAAKTVAPMAASKIREVEAPRSVLVQLLDCVIPAWSAGIQADMDVSERILRSPGNPCRHDENLHFHVLWVSVRS